MRQETRVVSLLAAFGLAGCCSEMPYCPTSDYSAECRNWNVRANSPAEPEPEQPQPIEPDYDRRNSN